jgi:hypothetical protein
MKQMSYQRYREVYGPPECQRSDCTADATAETNWKRCEYHD